MNKNYWTDYDVYFEYGANTFEIKIHKPIVTIDVFKFDEQNVRADHASGMAYCRPDDEWSPIIGIQKAVDNMLRSQAGLRMNAQAYSDETRRNIMKCMQKHIERIVKHKPQDLALAHFDAAIDAHIGAARMLARENAIDFKGFFELLQRVAD